MAQSEGDPARPTPSGTMTIGEAAEAVDRLDAQIRADWNTLPDRRVQMACCDVELVAEFVDRSLDEREVAKSIREALQGDAPYVEAIARIHSTIDDFSACMVAIDGGTLPDAGASGPGGHLVDTLTGLATVLRQHLEKAVDAFTSVVERTAVASDQSNRVNALLVANDVSRHLKARKFLQQTERALDKRVRADQEKAAVDAKVRQLGDYYAEHAEEETKRADQLRKVVAALLVLIACGAVLVNVWMEPASLPAELLRLSASIPIALLAGYFTKESSKHRLSAKWAHQLAIEMRSLPDYVDSLGDTGLDLRRAFGMRVFGASAEHADRSTEDGLFHEFVQAFRQALELMESRGKSK